MAKPVKKGKRGAQPPRRQPAAPVKKPSARVDWWTRLERLLSHRRQLFLYLCLGTALLFACLLFNARITDAADDALYIEAAHQYASHFFDYYYTFTAPLYCMFLALPIALFGVNLIVLKLFSVVFFVAGLFFFYVAFKDRVPYTILFPALLLTALNSLFLFYASQTYTEAFVLMLSGLFFVAWFRVVDATEHGADLKTNWRQFLLLGLTAFLLYLSRNVAAMVVAVLPLSFLFRKRYASALYATLAFVLFVAVYQYIVVPLCWGHLSLSSRFEGQGSSIFLKDAYNPGMGREDFFGMVVRFFENAKIYSSQFFELIGLKSAGSAHEYSFFAVLLLCAGVGVGFAIVRKNHYVQAAALYVAAFLGATFISLHAFWGQARFVMIYLPLLAIVLFYGIVALLQTRRTRWLLWMYPAAVAALLLLNLNTVAQKAKENFPILQKNLSGDRYYGFTPDWVNYFKMSEWAAENLDKESVIVCRKASMSFIYANGRKFGGINGVPSVTLDSALLPVHYDQRFVGLAAGETPPPIAHALRPYIVAVLMGDSQIHFAYNLPETLYPACVAELNRLQVPFHATPDDMAATMKQKYKNHYGLYPDELLGSLKDRQARYVIDASLRLNPAQKTDQIITTIRRYLYFIEQKYPGTFRKIHQTGADDNEPALLYEIHYPDTGS
jgi:hypothetical protein